MFLDYLAIGSGAILKVLSLYFVIVILFIFRKKKRTPHFPARTRFACIIAARNEEAVIGNLVRSLKDQDYPAELSEIYVIPNNCTDNTEKAAMEAGADIIHVSGPIRFKGDALKQAFRQLRKKTDIDAFLIFDADNIADPGYFRAMNDAFLSGAEVTKSRIDSRNPYSSWVSGCYGLYYTIFNRFFNEARSRAGLSPKLIGTGLGIKRDTLYSMGGWNTVTIAEDTEFNADAILADLDIRWVPEAVTYDETPDSFRVSLRQRLRWVKGIMDVGKERIPDLYYDMKSAPKPARHFDFAMILMLPYIQAVSLIPAILLYISAAIRGTLLITLGISALGLILSYAGLAVFGLMLSIFSPFETKRMAKAILLFPVFTFSWMPLCLISMFRKEITWSQIRHTGAASTANIRYYPVPVRD